MFRSHEEDWSALEESDGFVADSRTSQVSAVMTLAQMPASSVWKIWESAKALKVRIVGYVDSVVDRDGARLLREMGLEPGAQALFLDRRGSRCVLEVAGRTLALDGSLAGSILVAVQD